MEYGLKASGNPIGVLTAIGQPQSGGRHDKLSAIGFSFPIWGTRDNWSSKWLGIRVLPNNRLQSIDLLSLQLFKKHEGECSLRVTHQVINNQSFIGMPVQTSPDCGRETTDVSGLGYEEQEVNAQDNLE